MTTILRRLLELIPTLIGVSIITFFMIRLTPGDPARMMLGQDATPEAIAALRERLGFDLPLHRQYVRYMGGIMKGDLGDSITSKRPVWTEITARLPATIELAVASMFFSILTGIVVGVLSAVYRGSTIDNVTRFLVFVFLAMPSFWLGLELIIICSRNLEWFPPADRDVSTLYRRISHLILPSLTLGLGTGAFLCRILRSSMLEVLMADYVRTARAKGLNSRRVILKHALKNAMIPFVTVAGLSLGTLLGGSVIVETVFNWPGVGKLMIDSIKERDFPVTMGCVLILAVVFVVVNLLVDILYTVLDPRIRLDGGETQ